MVTLCARVGWPRAFSSKVGAACVKLAQPSHIYHVGILLSDGLLYQSRVSRGVYCERVDTSDPTWIKVPCPWADEDYALRYFRAREGNGYDTFGLLDWATRRVVLTLTGQEIRPGFQDPRREICSELSAGMLGFEQPIRWSPSAIVKACKARTGA